MKAIKIIFASALMTFTVVGIKITNEYQMKRTDFQLRNVEALANEEQKRYMCVGEGNVTCPSTGKKAKEVLTLNR